MRFKDNERLGLAQSNTDSFVFGIGVGEQFAKTFVDEHCSEEDLHETMQRSIADLAIEQAVDEMHSASVGGTTFTTPEFQATLAGAETGAQELIRKIVESRT